MPSTRLSLEYCAHAAVELPVGLPRVRALPNALDLIKVSDGTRARQQSLQICAIAVLALILVRALCAQLLNFCPAFGEPAAFIALIQQLFHVM